MKRPLRTLIWLVLLATLVVRYHNWDSYPFIYGMDAYGHAAYLDIVLDDGRIPSASESWATYHPPGYYLISASTAKLLGWESPPERYRAAQLVSALAGVVTLLILALAARQLAPEKATWCMLFLAALPIGILLSCQVYNGSLALMLVTTYLAFMVMIWDQPPSLPSEITLGLLLGLAVLVRTDAAVLGALFVWRSARLAWRAWPQRKTVRDVLAGMTLSLSLLGILTGWFFQRNIALYNKPLVSNLAPMTFPTSATGTLGLPGTLSLRNFVDTGGDIWQNPNSPEGMSSVPASLYASLWSNHSVLWYSREHLAPLRLLAGLLPSLVCLLGISATLREPSWQPIYGAMALNSLAMLGLLLNLPTYTGYKAVYLYPCFPGLALAFGAGLSRLETKNPVTGNVVQAGCLLCFAFLAYSLWWK